MGDEDGGADEDGVVMRMVVVMVGTMAAVT